MRHRRGEFSGRLAATSITYSKADFMLVSLLLILAGAAVDAQTVREIRASARSEHGLILVIGSTDAAFLHQLSDKKHLVHLLWRTDSTDSREADFAALRKQTHRAGLAGRVTVSEFNGHIKRLPDRTANVIVWRDRAPPSPNDLRAAWRMLQPEGALWIPSSQHQHISEQLPGARIQRRSSGWLLAVKPRSAKLDVWPQPRYNASRNAVSKDQLAGSPRGVRWSGGPLWPRGYRKSAVPAVNVGQRQLVYVLQDEVAEHGRMVSRDSLVARDAFNGLPLWKQPAVSHLLVTHGDRIYTVSDRRVVELSSRTGQRLRTLNTEFPRDIAIANERLLVMSRESIAAWHLDPEKPSRGPLWRHAGAPDRMLADAERVYFNVDQTRRGGAAKLVALELATGRLLWERSLESWAPAGSDLVSTGEGVLVLAGQDGNHAVATADGRPRWHYAYDRIGHGGSYEKVLILQGLVWVHVAKSPDSSGPAWIGLDPLSGKAVRRLPQPHDFKSKHRCSFDVATGRWLLCGSMDFANVATGDYEHFAAARNSCAAAGVVPANGLVYSFPHACGCYPMLRGVLALAADEKHAVAVSPVSRDNPVVPGEAVEGPAFDQMKAFPVEDARGRGAGGAGPDWQWSTFRATADRRGVSPRAMMKPSPDANLQVLWKTAVAKSGDRDALAWEWQLRDSVQTSPPVHSEGIVFVAATETHRLLALDARTSQLKWDFFAGARLEGPPTIVGQRCLFGARDGMAYCVRTKDGQLIWKRALVHHQPRIVAHGQLESAEPVRGASLVDGDTVMFVTGRHQSVGAGLWVHALDIATGAVRWQRRAASHPGVPDVLAGGGGVVQMGQWQSTVEMNVGAARPPLREFIRGGRLGLQDNTWYRRPIAMRRNLQQWTSPQKTAAGQLLCLGEQRSFAYRASERVLGANGLLFGRGRIEGRFKDPKLKPWTVTFGNASRVSGMVLAGDSLFVAGDFYEALFSSRETELRHYEAATGRLVQTVALPARPVHDGLISDAGLLFASLINGELVAVGFGKQGSGQ